MGEGFLQGLNRLQAARAGRLGELETTNALALQDPSIRALIEANPALGGRFGARPTELAGPTAPGTAPLLAPNLPARTWESQLDSLYRMAQISHLGAADPARMGVAPEGSELFSQAGNVFARTPSGQIIRMGGIPQTPPGLPPDIAATLNDMLRTQLGGGSPPQPGVGGAPLGAPAPSRVLEGRGLTPAVPEDAQPVGQLPFMEEDGSLGYPSGAFDVGAGTAGRTVGSMPPGTPRIIQPRGSLPPGVSIGLGRGGVSARISGASPTAERQPGEVQQRLSLFEGAAKAVNELEALAGAEVPNLQIMGYDTGVKPNLFGPTSGRLTGTGFTVNGPGSLDLPVGGLQTFSDQPLAQRGAAIDSKAAEVRTFIFNLTGAAIGPNEDKVIEGLLPNRNMPTKLYQQQVQRLKQYVTLVGSTQAQLAGLDDTQMATILKNMYYNVMSGAAEGATPALPPSPTATPGAPRRLQW